MINGPSCDFSETKSDRLLLLTVSGHADYLHCKPLKRFLDWNAHPTATAPVVIEFSHCKSVDSTVLGLIAQAALRMIVDGKPGLILANLDGAPLRSATQLGLMHLTRLARFDTSDSASESALTRDVVPLDRDAIRTAHEALVEANPSNRALFADFLSFSTPVSQD